MLPHSPSSSPQRPALVNLTNDECTLTVQSDRKRPSANHWLGGGDQKRVKLQDKETKLLHDSDDSDSEDESPRNPAQSTRRMHSVYGIRNTAMIAGPSSLSRMYSMPTRSILETFVSSNGSDVYASYPVEPESDCDRTPPYACAYSHGAKRGQDAFLAVTTEQGSVHIMNTAKRPDWEQEPTRTAWLAHQNGVFDVQWSPSDEKLATASADKTVRIWDLRPPGPVQMHELQHHASTVKCIAWDPSRNGNVLASGSRDGLICIWDMRVASSEGLKPVLAIPKSHDTAKPPGRRSRLAAPPARGVTSMLFSDADSHTLISAGSYDGILRQWDLRYLDKKRNTTTRATKNVSSPARTSSVDPTTCDDIGRPRGISSISAGTGPTAGLLFALSLDSRVHTYDLHSLEPLSGRTSDPRADMWSYGHQDMQVNGFYVRGSISPCGQWMACGGTSKGKAFAFDVSDAGRTRSCGADRGRGVELWGQRGEIGAVDWADRTLATCADDGSVRIWRADVEAYRRCEDDPEAMKWSWCWALGS